MNPLLLFGGAIAILAVVLLMIAVPARLIRGVAVSAAVVSAAFGLTTFAEDANMPAYSLATMGVILLALVRSRASRSGGVGFGAVAAWWTFVSLGVLMGSYYGSVRVILYFGLATLVAYVASSLATQELRMVYGTIAGVAAAQVAIAVVEILVLPEPIHGYKGGIRFNPFVGDLYARAQGTFEHPIVFAVFCGIAVVVAWSNPAQWSQKWRITNLSVATAGLALSGTRSAIAAVAAALLVHMMLNRSFSGWMRSALAVGAMVVVMLNIDIGIATLVTNLIQSGSWSHRLGALESLPQLLSRPPLEAWFGYGFGSQNALYDRGLMQQTYMRAVDNMFVYALGTMGIVGLGALLAFWAVAFVVADRLRRALLALLFAMFFSFDLFTWISMGVLASMMIALPRTDSRSPVVSVRQQPALAP